MGAPQTTPAGWYPDPDGDGDLRWWDGAAWTTHRAIPRGPSAPAPTLPPPPAVVGNEFAALAAAHRGQLPGVGPPPLRRGRGIPPLLGVIAGLPVGIGTAGVFAASDDARLPLVVGCVALVALPSGWQALWNRWRILDTPTLDAAGARPGTCEIVGRVEIAPGQVAVAAPLSGLPTLAWRQAVDRWQKRGKGHAWVERWRDADGAAVTRGFRLRSDHGGAVWVRVRDADRVLRPTIEPHEVVGGGWFADKHRLREAGLVVGDQLFCLGEIVMAADGQLVLDDPGVVQHGDERTCLRTQGGRVLAGVAGGTTLVAGIAAYAAGAPESADAEELARPLVAAGASVGALLVVAAVLLAIRWWNRLVALAEQVRAAWAHLEVDLQRRADTIRGLVEVVRSAAAHEVQTLEAAARARGALGGAAPPDLAAPPGPEVPQGTGVAPGAQPAPGSGGQVELAGTVRRGVPDADRVVSADAAVVSGGATERNLLAIAERYPALRAGDAYRQLFEALVAVEDRIAAGRRFYNDAILLLDTRVDTFPGLLVRQRVLPTPRPRPLEFTAADLPSATHTRRSSGLA